MKMMRPFWRFRLRQLPGKITETDEDQYIGLKFGLTRYTLPPEDVSALWKRVRQTDSLIDKINKRWTRKQWYWAAAVLLMGTTVSLYLARPGQAEYRTAFGETKTLILPDGSTVILNANSRVT